MYYISHNRLNKYSGLFVQQIFKNSIDSCGFGYGKGLTGTRFKSRKIVIPVNSAGEPDWDFMEAYMRQEEKKILDQVVPHLQQKLLDNLMAVGGVPGTKWKTFRFDEVFENIQRGKRFKKADHTPGDTPYISSSAVNNGVDGFSAEAEKNRIFANCLTVANSGSVGKAFYHRYRFIASDHVTALYTQSFPEEAYLFIAPIVDRLSEKYSFNREINDARIKREKLILPVTEAGELNIAFMVETVKKIQRDKLGFVTELLTTRRAELETLLKKRGGVVHNLVRDTFFIEDVFEVLGGRDIYEQERIEGDYPYITATARNNGVGYFVANQNNTYEAGCLSVNRNGSVGYCFYQPYKALYGNDTRKLRPVFKSDYASKFISLCISQQKDKFGYGYKMGTARLKRQKIQLPIDTDASEPAWFEMEQFMRVKEVYSILNYLRHESIKRI